MTTFALRGSLESGGYVQHPLHSETQPSLDEAKERCASLVGLMPDATVWTIEVDEKPAPQKQEVKA